MTIVPLKDQYLPFHVFILITALRQPLARLENLE